MLASLGRRYLLQLVNSGPYSCLVHRLPPGHCEQAAATHQLLQYHGLTTSTSSSTPAAAGDGTDQQQQQLPTNADTWQPQAAAAQQQDVQQHPVGLAAAPLAAAATQKVPTQQPQAAAQLGPRKVDAAAFGGRQGPRVKREGVVHINSTFNNTHLVLTDRDSKVETWVSGGTVGYKNANKASPMAAEVAAKELARRALDKGFHAVVVKLKGMGRNKQFAVASLAASGLTVTEIWDVTPIPYNGCRLPRRRRV